MLGPVAILLLLAYTLRPDANEWKLAKARLAKTKPEFALQLVDEVLKSDPRNLQAHDLRVALLINSDRTQEAIETIGQLLKDSETPQPQRQRSLEVRAELLQRVGKHREAISDAAAALKIAESSATGSESDQLLALMRPRNNYAYVIARAAAAQAADRQQVADAQRNMQQVFAGLEVARRENRLPESEPPWWWKLLFGSPTRNEPLDRLAQIQFWQIEAGFLDTAAYVELAAGNAPAALRDFNRVLQLCATLELQLREHAATLTAEQRGQLQSALKQAQIVARHHRGETLIALGNRVEGERDMQLAVRQGYSRENGDW